MMQLFLLDLVMSGGKLKVELGYWPMKEPLGSALTG